MSWNPRRVSWRAWTGLAVAIVLAIVLAVVAGQLVVRWYGPAFARDRVEAALARALERPVRVGAVTLRPWLARVDVEGVAIAAGPTWNDGTLLEVDRVAVSAAIASLWQGRLVARIVLDGVALEVTLDGGGSVDLPSTLPDEIAVGPLRIALRAVEVHRGTLAVRDPAAARAVVLDGLDALATPAGGGVDATVRGGALTLTAPGLRETVESLSTSLSLRGDRLAVERLEARWQGQRLAVSGEVRGLGRETTLALTVEGAVPAPWLATTFEVDWPLEGRIAARAVVDGPALAPGVSAEVRIADLRAGPISARDVTARLAWDGRTLSLTYASARAFGGRVAGVLRWAPGEPEATHLDISVDGVALPELERVARLDVGLRGTLSGAGELRGDPATWAQIAQPARTRAAATPRGRFEITDAQLTLPGTAAKLGTGVVRGDLRLTDAGIEIERADARWSTLRVDRLRGHLDASGPSGIAGMLSADVGHLATLFGGAPVRGTATLTATLEGRWSDLQIAGQARARDLLVHDARLAEVGVDFSARGRTDSAAAWRVQGTATGGPLELRGERVEGLAATFEASAQRVDVPRLTARVRDVPLRLAGSWSRDGVVTVNGDAGPARLAALPGVSATAQLDGSATARGEAAWRDGRWSGTATLDGRNVRAAGVALGAGTVDVTVRDRDVTAALRFPGARISGEVTTRLDGTAPAAVRVEFTGLDLGPLLTRLPAIPEPIAPVRGAVSGSAEFTIPLDAPARARGSVRLASVRLTAAGEPWEATEPVVLQREPGVTRIVRAAVRSVATTAAAAGENQALRATGSVGDDGRLALTIDGRLVLAALPRLRPEIREAQGAVDATLSVSGRPDAVEVSGRARVRAAHVRLRDLEAPLTDVQADLALAPDRVRVDAGRASVLGSTVTVSGDIALASTVRLHLAVHGEVPLGVVADLRPEIIEARGTLSVDVRVGGTPARPEATGDATLRADSLVLRDHPTPLRDVRARLRATPARIAVTEATARVGGGTVRARGDVALHEFSPGAFAFTIEARHVLVQPSPDFTTVWDADLELSGAGARARLQGDARLVRGALVRETPLLRGLLEPGRGGAAAAGEGLGLAIRVHLGDSLVVRTAVARFRARGTLDVQGTTASPIVFGTLEAVDGHVAFHRHRFALTRASARFLDPRRIDPVLDVQGTTRIGSYDVRLQMSGRTEDLEVRLSSTPPLPEEDLLSLVAFGATRADLGKRGTTAVAGEVAGLILKDFFGVGAGEGGLGLVDSVELSNSDTAGRAVEVGKRVGDRATFRYSQGVDDSTERRLRVEYEVIGPVLIAGEQDFRGGFGADVLLRFRFR